MVSRARLKLYRSLRRRSARVSEGLFLVEGRRLVVEALRSGAPVVELLVTAAFSRSDPGRVTLEAAAEAGVGAEVVAESDLGRIAETKSPQGVVGVVSRRDPDSASLAASGLHLVLDGVADPGNVGTLIRAADAFGVASVLAGPGCADFEGGKVLRAAMGSTFHLPLHRTENLAADLAAFRDAGATVLAGTTRGEDVYAGVDLADASFLVLGSEAHGVSADVLATVEREVLVPCPGRAESLNVAMAGAILLSVLVRRK